MENENSISNYLQTIVDSVNGNEEQFGNVIFTEKGIVTLKTYSQEENPFFIPLKAEGAFLLDMEVLIKDRMQHCLDELEKHLSDKDVWISRDIIAWQGGHFSKPTYKAMQEFIDKGYCSFVSAKDHLALMSQQVVRHLMYLQRNSIDFPLLQHTPEEIFNICTEIMIKYSPIKSANEILCRGIEEDED